VDDPGASVHRVPHSPLRLHGQRIRRLPSLLHRQALQRAISPINVNL
jgi:hypothetical protein